MWRIFKTAHDKVADFRKGRTRRTDEQFVADCELPDDPDAFRIAVAVRRAVAGVGLVDPLFIHATDRFPEDLGALPLWDSIDWMSLIIMLEEELDEEVPTSILEWRQSSAFTVKELVRAVLDQMTRRAPG